MYFRYERFTMHFNDSKILWSVLLLVGTHLGLVLGLHTENCNQQQLESKTLETLRRWKVLDKETLHLLGTSNATLGCDFIDKYNSSFVEHLGTCFSAEIRHDAATLFDFWEVKLTENATELTEFCTNCNRISCNRIEGPRKSEINKTFIAMVARYEQDLQRGNVFGTIIQYTDNNCSIENFLQSMGQDMLCLTNNTNQIYQNLQNKPSMPICKAVVEALSCIGANQCLSKNEADFLKKLTATIYDYVMSLIVEAMEIFGSYSNFMKSVGAEQFVTDELSANETDIMVQLYINDYKVSPKTKDCLPYHIL